MNFVARSPGAIHWQANLWNPRVGGERVCRAAVARLPLTGSVYLVDSATDQADERHPLEVEGHLFQGAGRWFGRIAFFEGGAANLNSDLAPPGADAAWRCQMKVDAEMRTNWRRREYGEQYDDFQ